MYFQQFYLTCLSHASYMLGSEGVAVVVDPQRDVSLYIDEAATQGLKIEHVIETHLHADFVSGHRELAERTGAKIYLGARAGATFPHVDVHDGDGLNSAARFCDGRRLRDIPSSVVDRRDGSDRRETLCGAYRRYVVHRRRHRPDLAPDLTPQQLAGCCSTACIRNCCLW